MRDVRGALLNALVQVEAAAVFDAVLQECEATFVRARALSDNVDTERKRWSSE